MNDFLQKKFGEMDEMANQPQLDYRFQYVMENNLQYVDADCFDNYFELEVYVQSEDPGVGFLTIAKAEFCKIKFGKFIEKNLGYYDLHDFSGAVCEIGGAILEEETGKYIPKLLNSLGKKSLGSDILYLYAMEILPAYRKTGLGHRIIKDIYMRFQSGCKFMAVKAKPREEAVSQYDEWGMSLQLEDLKKDAELDQYKIYSYLQKLGFQNHLKDEFFFINPALKNPKLDKIQIHVSEAFF